MGYEYDGSMNEATRIVNMYEFFDYDYIDEVLQHQIMPDIAKRFHQSKNEQFHTVANNLLADWMQQYFEEMIEEYLGSNMPHFIRELIHANEIDWKLLASHYEELIEEYYQMDLRGVVATQ